MQIQEVFDQKVKSDICNIILRELPDWFGVEASIVDYVSKVKTMPFYAVFDEQTPVGFAAIKIHNTFTAEVCVMGVINRYQRGG